MCVARVYGGGTPDTVHPVLRVDMGVRVDTGAGAGAGADARAGVPAEVVRRH